MVTVAPFQTRPDERLLGELQEQFMAVSRQLFDACGLAETDRELLCYAPMKRLLNNKESYLCADGVSLGAMEQLRKEHRACFSEYLRLLIADSRASFLASARDDVEAGRAEVGVLFGRRMSREMSFIELRWLVVKHRFGCDIKPAQVERMVAIALANPQHRAAELL